MNWSDQAINISISLSLYLETASSSLPTLHKLCNSLLGNLVTSLCYGILKWTIFTSFYVFVIHNSNFSLSPLQFSISESSNHHFNFQLTILNLYAWKRTCNMFCVWLISLDIMAFTCIYVAKWKSGILMPSPHSFSSKLLWLFGVFCVSFSIFF